MSGITSGRTWLRRVLVRTLGSVLVVWAAVSLAFLALKLIPGDPVLTILGGPGSAPSEATIEAARVQYGLDQPVVVQYLNYLGDILHGDLGMSYVKKSPVITYLLPQVGPTLQLTIASIVAAWTLALLLALFTVRRGRLADAIGRGVEVVFAAIPPFWIALVLLVVFAFTLRWVPPSGSDPRTIVLPALAMAIPLAGFLAQVTREALDDALAQPFVLTARARGAGEWRVRVVHGLRHALLPAISLSGWAVGSLISGAVVAEVIFARQGLGRSLVDAIVARDSPIVVAVVLFISLVYVVVNLGVDVASRIVDPRIVRTESE
ncbi:MULTISPECIES: ABC transporter permease [Microbacterium]|uniref:ABC transporter permease n=1 Tax=Microbacterium TaxID=33882 RepID=UPI0027D8A1E3|nr:MULTISPECIES: ABC transporter permease [Microbacterium]